MARIIDIASQPITASRVGQSGPLWEAPEVAVYEVLDLQLQLLNLGAATSCLITLVTGMDTGNVAGSLYSPTDWVYPVGGVTFGNVTTAPSYLISTESLACLRYVSWHLGAMTGAGPVTFTIRGMARRYHI